MELVWELEVGVRKEADSTCANDCGVGAGANWGRDGSRSVSGLSVSLLKCQRMIISCNESETLCFSCKEIIELGEGDKG
jgi:hypothetical protein